MKRYTFKLNKLVRDNVEQKLRDSDIDVEVSQLNELSNTIQFFKAKLNEEAEEVLNAYTVEEIVKELADCLEVIHGFIAYLKVPKGSFEHIRLDKLESHGGFQSGTIVDTITITEGNPALDYYLQDPVKYPQITDLDGE